MGCNILKCTCGKKHYFPQRYILAIFCLTGVIVTYGQRVSLNLAITTMTNKTVSASKSCPARNTSFTRTPKNITGGVIPWSNVHQNYVLSSFYPGYLLGHLPVGILCDKFGGRYVFIGGVGISTLFTFLTPLVVVNLPWYCTMVLRGCIGLGQAVVYPTISCLYAMWIPSEERSLLGSFSFGANALGVICGTFLTGMIIQLLSNWPSSFYMWGGIGALWCVLYIIFVYSRPSSHPNITDKEKTILEQKLIKPSRTLKFPIKAVLLDWAVWGLVVCEIGHDFTIFTLMNNFPKYLSDVLKYELTENSLVSSLPYLCQWIGALIFGRIADYVIKNKNYSVVWTRRILTTIGMVPPAMFIVAAGYMGCDGTWVIVMFCFNLFTKGAFYCGMKVNLLDMTINFTGIVMAMENGLGAIAGWISPPIISALAPNNELEEFQLVFWLVLLVAILTDLFYVIVCTGRRRKWDVSEEEMEDFLKEEEERKAKEKEKKDRKKAEKQKKKEEAQKMKEEASTS